MSVEIPTASTTDGLHEADDCASFIAALGLDEEPTRAAASPTRRLHFVHPTLMLPWSTKLASSSKHGETCSNEDYTSPACQYLLGIADDSAGWVLNHLCVTVSGLQRVEAVILHRHHTHMLQRSPTPLSTGETLYLPSTYSMLSQVLPQRAQLISGQRVIELGAGLGLLSSVLQQVEPSPSRLAATDGDVAVLPLLRANLRANQQRRGSSSGDGSNNGSGRSNDGSGDDSSGSSGDRDNDAADTEVTHLLWGQPLPNGFSGAFDVCLAADCIFLAVPPQGTHSRLGTDAETSRQVHALLESAAALLDPEVYPPACVVLTVEPRDRLNASADPVRTLVPRAAEAAGLHCVHSSERRLGVPQPDWQTDVLVFELSQRTEESRRGPGCARGDPHPDWSADREKNLCSA